MWVEADLFLPINKGGKLLLLVGNLCVTNNEQRGNHYDVLCIICCIIFCIVLFCFVCLYVFGVWPVQRLSSTKEGNRGRLLLLAAIRSMITNLVPNCVVCIVLFKYIYIRGADQGSCKIGTYHRQRREINKIFKSQKRNVMPSLTTRLHKKLRLQRML